MTLATGPGQVSDHPRSWPQEHIGVPLGLRTSEGRCSFHVAGLDLFTKLRTWCGDRLARYKVPGRVVVVEDLPRNATGKTLEASLRDRARDL
jgi:acyl-CoA synthetase (AMP-forming)/AMP-acid ligase II